MIATVLLSQDLNKVRRLLENRQAELENELARLIEPPTEGAAVSFGKRVGEGTAEAVERLSTTAAARSITASITGIDRALEKIAEGTYGICDECGLRIGAARLEALPAASLCMGCAAVR